MYMDSDWDFYEKYQGLTQQQMITSFWSEWYSRSRWYIIN